MTIAKLGILKVAPIVKIIDETPKDSRLPIKAITVKIPEIAIKASPGQFIMMWLYGVDEKPMGIASCDIKTGELTFAVAKLGEATTAIHQLKKGDLLGIRGPFGKGFSLKGKNIAVIGGGTGIAPIRYLIEEALKKKSIEVTLFHGARSSNELAFRLYFENLDNKNSNFNYKPSTDDGSFGFEGFSTQCLEASFIEGESYDQIYTCGPELMMLAAFKQAEARNVPLEASLADRYFKCAIGLCGQCTVDPVGLRLCIDGPVLNQDQLAKVSDFGKYSRDKFGRKESF